ncbi:MAG TPA: hypothetical protein VG936_14850 [Lacunisphaera sp.]|nr:hypothetical protein [Lacunisphaera sp.]
MESSATPFEPQSAKPIRIGLTCWRWQSRKAQSIVRLAQQFGVTVQMTETIHGLHREIEAQVSGANLDQFLGEFARQC